MIFREMVKAALCAAALVAVPVQVSSQALIERQTKIAAELIEDAQPVRQTKIAAFIVEDDALPEHLTDVLGPAAPRVAPSRDGKLAQIFAPYRNRSIVEVAHTRTWVDAQPVATGNAEWACLAEALYFEARGESVAGIFAVAEVILNRVDDSYFPDTVCRVVNQGTGRKYQCQFTYTCDGNSEVVRNPSAYRKVGKIARAMLDGAPRGLTGGATYYHTRAVNPRWSRVFSRTTTIGAHHFYVG